MVTKKQASEVAERYLRELGTNVGLELVLLSEFTLEGAWGWMFFYDSRAFVEAGILSAALAGNAPVIVSRGDGSLHVTGTAFPPARYIDNFIATGDPHRP